VRSVTLSAVDYELQGFFGRSAVSAVSWKQITEHRHVSDLNLSRIDTRIHIKRSRTLVLQYYAGCPLIDSAELEVSSMMRCPHQIRRQCCYYLHISRDYLTKLFNL